jgi:hypothetical protein
MMRYVLATPHQPRHGEAMLRMDAGGPQLYSEGHLAAILATSPQGRLCLPAKAMAAITRARRMPSYGILMTRIVGCIAALSLRTDGRAERSAAW